MADQDNPAGRRLYYQDTYTSPQAQYAFSTGSSSPSLSDVYRRNSIASTHPINKLVIGSVPDSETSSSHHSPVKELGQAINQLVIGSVPESEDLSSYYSPPAKEPAPKSVVYRTPQDLAIRRIMQPFDPGFGSERRHSCDDAYLVNGNLATPLQVSASSYSPTSHGDVGAAPRRSQSDATWHELSQSVQLMADLSLNTEQESTPHRSKPNVTGYRPSQDLQPTADLGFGTGLEIISRRPKQGQSERLQVVLYSQAPSRADDTKEAEPEEEAESDKGWVPSPSWNGFAPVRPQTQQTPARGRRQATRTRPSAEVLREEEREHTMAEGQDHFGEGGRGRGRRGRDRGRYRRTYQRGRGGARGSMNLPRGPFYNTPGGPMNAFGSSHFQPIPGYTPGYAGGFVGTSSPGVGPQLGHSAGHPQYQYGAGQQGQGQSANYLQSHFDALSLSPPPSESPRTRLAFLRSLTDHYTQCAPTDTSPTPSIAHPSEHNQYHTHNPQGPEQYHQQHTYGSQAPSQYGTGFPMPSPQHSFQGPYRQQRGQPIVPSAGAYNQSTAMDSYYNPQTYGQQMNLRSGYRPAYSQVEAYAQQPQLAFDDIENQAATTSSSVAYPWNGTGPTSG